ncbi:MAG: hypothetical protein WCQ59_08700 [Candidatus Cloacimonadaceae bacterium]|jgi:hypothetical protein
MPSLTKPTNVVDIGDYQNILKCKMHAYLAYGTMEDGEIPSRLKELESSYNPLDSVRGVFVPLGDLAKDPIEYGWSHETEEVHAGKLRGLLNIEGNIKCINVGQDMIDLLDEDSMDGDCTLLLVPFGNPGWEEVGPDNPAFAVVVRGVSIVDSGKGNGNGKFGEVVLEYNAQPDEIGDSILLLKYDEAEL